ncbi:MAG: YdhR family protein [Acidobacteria bacterium]|nr:YdhR family protein [Acidobacteriota bacterium]
MSHQILQVNFKFNVAREQYENTVTPLAQDFADVPGCLWKIWLMNEADSEAGGIYLFADEAAVETFKASPLVASVLSHPALSDFSIKQFEVLEKISRATRAPLAAAGAAA